MMSRAAPRPGPRSEPLGIGKGKVICSGLRPGGWFDTHRSHERFPDHAVVQAGDIRTPDDPLAWHSLPPAAEIGRRRHRRIDLWSRGGVLFVDAFFRDVCWEPDGSELALHEYTIGASADAGDHTLITLDATPRVLPFPECKWAAPHAARIVGTPVTSFRTTVQQTLTELKACTHLNDRLRSLAEVPALAASL